MHLKMFPKPLSAPARAGRLRPPLGKLYRFDLHFECLGYDVPRLRPRIPKIGADELATTVTATSGALTHTTTLTLNVQ